MRSRLFATLVALALCAAVLLGGCTTKTPQPTATPAPVATVEPTAAVATEPPAPEPVKVEATFFEWGWEGPDPAQDKCVAEIAKRTGVTMNVHRWIITSEEECKRQLNLWVSSNEIPEMLMIPTDGFTVDLMNQMGDADRIWNVESFAGKIGQDVQSMLQPAMKYYASPTTHKMYIYPTQINDYDAMIQMDNIAQEGIIIRKDWLEKVGRGYPATPQDLYDTLVDFRDKIADVGGQKVIPMLLNENFGGSDYFMKMFFDSSDRAWGFRKAADGSYTNQFDQAKLEAYAVFMNRLYREGLMDKEVSTIKDSQYQEKMNSGRVGVTGQAWWNMNTYNDNISATIDKACFYALAPIPKGEGVTQPVQQFITPTAPCALVFNKSVEEARMNRVFDMLAFQSTKDGVIIGMYGIQGEHWVTDANGKIVVAPDFLKKTGGDWNKGVVEGVGYYAGLGVKIAIINDMIAPYAYLERPDIVESRKNLQGTIILAADAQDLVPPGAVQTKLGSGYNTAVRDMLVNAYIASSEAECRSIIATYPSIWDTMGGKEMSAEKTTLVNGTK